MSELKKGRKKGGKKAVKMCMPRAESAENGERRDVWRRLIRWLRVVWW